VVSAACLPCGSVVRSKGGSRLLQLLLTWDARARSRSALTETLEHVAILLATTSRAAFAADNAADAKSRASSSSSSLSSCA
jgi:hypothetical protein